MKIERYVIVDTRDEFGKWSVTDGEKIRENPFNWRATIVFMGKKRECKEFIERQGK